MPTIDTRQMPMGTRLALHGSDVDVQTREARLGLVMYGGVSLAIYINGVAHEFFRAVQGQGIYRLLKTLTDSDLVVDIISGTADYQICHRASNTTRTIWRSSSRPNRCTSSWRSRFPNVAT
jgi:hypothetical protein